MSADLSIIIPSRHRPDLLARCLLSVRRHLPPRTEILVVDDASAHGEAVRLAKRYGARALSFRRPRGFCAAANAGIECAKGAVVELLNDDTQVTASWTVRPLEHFQDSTIGAVAPLVLFPPSERGGRLRIDSAGDGYHAAGIARKRSHGRLLDRGSLRSCRVFGASASAAFYRREALMCVGGFPESFGAYFEDVDLSFRLNRAGYSILFEPESRVFHVGSASYGSRSRRLVEMQSRNEERVFWRNLPRQTLARAWPAHLAILALKAWRRWEDGNLAPFLCGRLRLLGELPELLRHRRRLEKRFPIDARNKSLWQN